MSKAKSQSSSVTSWFHRKVQLQTLLGNCGDDEEEGIALDRILHGQSVIGRTQKTIEIENVRFSDKDLVSFGPLADAQFGTVELVNCRFDGRVYVRKRVSKKFALKNREQCSPQYERHILLLGLKSLSRSSSMRMPHMLCAYQCQNFLNIVMEYAAGGSLWDVLESSTDGRLATSDLEWWAPQCISAIDWLHTRAGFAHRDVKPHNFVLRPGSSPHLLLIDFGSAAPLLKPDEDGVQYVPRSHCLVPCGTCDYISPEILRAHEEALVALEMSDDEDENVIDSDKELSGGRKDKIGKKVLQDDVGYGRETDWWSLGVMLYELAFGVAPFFASDIRQTYARITNHKSNLTFDRSVHVPPALVSLIKGLLTHHENRLGRNANDELRKHAYFKNIDWSNLHSRPPPPNILLPEFTYTTPLIPPELGDDNSESSDASKPFAFSALFQSSTASKPDASPFHQDHRDLTGTPSFGRRSLSRRGSSGSVQRSLASFIGFSWGPPKDAFDDATRIVPAEPASAEPGLCVPLPGSTEVEVSPQREPITPKRPSKGVVPPSTVRVTSVRRSVQARPVSEREAMRMLVDCVGQSARKRVLESGKKPKVLLPEFGFGAPPPVISSAALRDSLGKARPRAPSLSRSSPKLSAASAVRKELRFDDTAPQIMPNLSYTNTFTTTLTMSNSAASGGAIPYVPPPYSASDSGTMSEVEGPPSPSPSPRPGSAMSMLSMSRRSTTPTVSSGFLTSVGAGYLRAGSEPPEARPGRHARARSGSLGSLNSGKSLGKAVYGEDSDVDVKGEQGPPRRARFAELNSSESSPERGTKTRVPATPHPKPPLKGTNAKEEGVRHALVADLSDSAPFGGPTKVESVNAHSTPHPRAQNKATTTRETRFLDAETPPKTASRRVHSTPHPNARAKAARRVSKPPLQARTMARVTSTPARPDTHRLLSKVPDALDSLSDENDIIRPFSRGNDRFRDVTEEVEPRDESEVALVDEEPEPEQTYARCRNPSPPSFLDEEVDYGSFRPERDSECNFDDGGFDKLDNMERRFKHLLADIANLSLHVDDFASSVCRV